ncbi:hypothetical protein ACVR1N_02455 [Streptococcus constellatus subsp. pharyngis]|uniref:Uncharacterized protein n=1 Tax=Streptococcus constellatus subsp. pharyngis SK1060 = CCUG 46377 TaxID=1035184 RepID=U2YCD4_STRCV|nr:hypothetical protein [Streptococcus constellatus]AGU72739.1 hypothetical protein SCRE_0902 [Streptococcus constellatus subsp. pharyngis C232]AGU74495.1 hypothetical protein SCR2_0902 [Streptococcus constellatus subsp. pharyngis C818]AGU79912.1 hypothetical protein SCI_0974 [Streptococcus constellatus subsp. pharyngis C1050]QRP82168.1 hypothetical protein I6J38_02555 [Streptococcus constellatus]GAD44602.1 hypothetical protein ANG5_1130 [Streptococcus constellatus subsp. pharyngis SK1060 = CC
MARQNYFEILEQMDFDPDKEFEIISNLILKLKEISPYTTESIRDVFNRNFWLYENYRKMQFRSYDEAKDYFNNNFNGPDRLFTYIEFIIDLNSFMISNGKILTFTKATLIKEFPKVRERIDYCLAKNNHELKELENGRQIIVEKNVYASEVSQIISETNIEDAIKVLEYNHFSNKRNIQRKKEMLISLANYLEPLRDELNAFEELKEVMKVNSKKIIAVEQLFGMYNNLGLRHNNDKQYHLNMNDEELEQWYDDIYTSTLFVILSLDEARILSKLKTLREG